MVEGVLILRLRRKMSPNRIHGEHSVSPRDDGTATS